MNHEHRAATEVVDPACGMSIGPEDATGNVEYKGTTYYLCNPCCEAKFREHPQDYVGAERPAKPTGPADEEYTCPMEPEVRQIGPGSCPKCGMALQPATFALPKARTEYMCPMHPEVVRSEPGACPICGMALEAREVTGDDMNPELVDMTHRFWVSVGLTLSTLLFMISTSCQADHSLNGSASLYRAGCSSRLQLL